MCLVFAYRVLTYRDSAEMLLHHLLASIPAATTNCAALMFVQQHRTHLFLCGQTSRLPIQTARLFLFSRATILWAISPSRSPFIALSLSVATSREHHRSNIAFRLPARS